MSEKDHAEPWQAVEVFGTLPYIVSPGTQTVIAERVFNGHHRRIVACVNACRGIPTEELESFEPDALSSVADEWRHERNKGG